MGGSNRGGANPRGPMGGVKPGDTNPPWAPRVGQTRGKDKHHHHHHHHKKTIGRVGPFNMFDVYTNSEGRVALVGHGRPAPASAAQKQKSGGGGPLIRHVNVLNQVNLLVVELNLF